MLWQNPTPPERMYEAERRVKQMQEEGENQRHFPDDPRGRPGRGFCIVTGLVVLAAVVGLVFYFHLY